MSVFSLHAAVVDDYRHFVQSFFTVADERARGYVERALVDERAGTPVTWRGVAAKIDPWRDSTSLPESARVHRALHPFLNISPPDKEKFAIS